VSLSQDLSSPATVELDASGKDALTHAELDRILADLGVGAYRRGEVYWAIEGANEGGKVSSTARSMKLFRFYGPLTDPRDDEVYRVIRTTDPLTGDYAVWIADNMRATKYSDGTALTLNSDYAKFDTQDAAAGPLNKLRGCLYTWPATVRDVAAVTSGKKVQGICPEGWHVGTREDWDFLINTQPDVTAPATSMKDPVGWASANDKGTNESKFNVVPAGYIWEPVSANFADILERETFTSFWMADVPVEGDEIPWSPPASEFPNQAYSYSIYGTDGYISLYVYNRERGYSARCVLND
jgi:uncharacterized protein (TIGR02145 family)